MDKFFGNSIESADRSLGLVLNAGNPECVFLV